MQYIEAVSNEAAQYPDKLFLGGGITGIPDWQKIVVAAVEHLPITVFNPRRANFPIDDPNAAEEQITWEHAKLAESNAITFWFFKETLCPIVLFEYGKELGRLGGEGLEHYPALFVGMDPEYGRKQDVEIQTELELSLLDMEQQFPFTYTVEDMCAQIVEYFEKVRGLV